MDKLNADQAREMFPKVKGPIFGADLWSGFAILDMGVGAYGVMVAGKFVACCPDYTAAKINGETFANVAIADRGPRMPKSVVAFALKHQISLGAVHSGLGAWIEYYYIVDAAGNQVDTTRSHRPTAKNALALCRRYLTRRGLQS